MPGPVKKVPARYIGITPLQLAPAGRPYFDGEGNLRKRLTLYKGDVVMWEAHNVLGQTHLRQRATGKRWFLGYGRKVLAEHAQMSDEELYVLGYEFDTGRDDLEPVTPDETPAQMPAEPAPEDLPPELAAAVEEAEAERRHQERAAQAAEPPPLIAVQAPVEEAPPAEAAPAPDEASLIEPAPPDAPDPTQPSSSASEEA